MDQGSKNKATKIKSVTQFWWKLSKASWRGQLLILQKSCQSDPKTVEILVRIYQCEVQIRCCSTEPMLCRKELQRAQDLIHAALRRDSQGSWRTLPVLCSPVLCAAAAAVTHVCRCMMPYPSHQCTPGTNSATIIFFQEKISLFFSTASVMDCRMPSQISCHTRSISSQEHTMVRA